MERYGSELVFISRICGDGKEIKKIGENENIDFIQDELFKLNSLSISNRTYIASGMSTYVVKLKNPPK